MILKKDVLGTFEWCNKTNSFWKLVNKWKNICNSYIIKYNWPLNNTGVRGLDTPQSRKSIYNFAVSPLTSTVPHIGVQPAWGRIVLEYVFSLKNLCISRTAQFKSELFNVYILNRQVTKDKSWMSNPMVSVIGISSYPA